MRKKLIVTILIVLVISLGILFAFIVMKNYKRMPQTDNQKKSLNDNRSLVTVHAQLTNQGMLPVIATTKVGQFIVFDNKTDKDMKISLKGTVNVDEFPVLKGKSAAGPVFGKAGNVDVLDAVTKTKLGSIIVTD